MLVYWNEQISQEAIEIDRMESEYSVIEPIIELLKSQRKLQTVSDTIIINIGNSMDHGNVKMMMIDLMLSD